MKDSSRKKKAAAPVKKSEKTGSKADSGFAALRPVASATEIAVEPVKAVKAKPLRKQRTLPDIFYDRARGTYLIQNSGGEWLPLTESQIQRELRNWGVDSKRWGQTASDMDKVLSHISRTRDVAYAGPLAGHLVGLLSANGRRILVTESPRIISPVAGLFPLIERVLNALFPPSPLGDRQRLHFCLWLKVAYESLRAGIRQPGQALAIAGPVECGKSLLQLIITLVLGGREARPYPYMSGVTHFNAELFAAEHLVIEDEQSSSDSRTRRAFAASLKQFTVAGEQRCEGKYRPALSLEPLWRVSISLNDEPENLTVLPPMTPDILDKVILLKASKNPMPMPTNSPRERRAFREALDSELPHFIHYLCGLQIPPSLGSARFGVTHFHHPEILAALSESTRSGQLLRLIDFELFGNASTAPAWRGSAAELRNQLLRGKAKRQNESGGILASANVVGALLGHLAASEAHGRIRYERTANWRGWILLPPLSEGAT